MILVVNIYLSREFQIFLLVYCSPFLIHYGEIYFQTDVFRLVWYQEYQNNMILNIYVRYTHQNSPSSPKSTSKRFLSSAEIFFQVLELLKKRIKILFIQSKKKMVINSNNLKKNTDHLKIEFQLVNIEVNVFATMFNWLCNYNIEITFNSYRYLNEFNPKVNKE